MSSSDVERWNTIAESWHRWIPKMHAWYEPATELMLDLARISPGNRVLDIAAGDGDQSLAAAGRIGPSGHILAILDTSGSNGSGGVCSLSTRYFTHIKGDTIAGLAGGAHIRMAGN